MRPKPYEIDLINALRNATSQERIEYFEVMFQKNLNFFKTESPMLFGMLKSSSQDTFEINLTETFFDIIDSKTKQAIHPIGMLDNYAEQLGQWINLAWVDLLNFKVSISQFEDSIHNKCCRAIEAKTLGKFPGLPNVNQTKKINLKLDSDENVRYAPAVAFIGMSHGLHIIEYLRKTKHSHVLLYEPDPEKFVLSCYFLDYQSIKDSCKKYFLGVGENNFSVVAKLLLQDKQISPYSWVRVLPSENIENYASKVAQLKSLQMSKNDLFFPIDLQLKGFKSAANFFSEHVPLLTNNLKISAQSNIAIIGSGPSVVHDLDWLKANEKKIIIFSALSSVKLLVDNNIKVDFIFTLDSYSHHDNIKETFSIPDNVPIIAVYHTAKEFGEINNPLLLCGIERERNLVRFKLPVLFFGASTGNMALGFALMCQPKNIYLLGCDCAFSEDGMTAALGTSHEEELQKKFHGGSTGLEVKSNLHPDKNVRSNVMLYDISYSMELSISQYNQGTNIFNLSKTGAFIGGTKPARSEDLIIQTDMEKQTDIDKIIKSFEPAKKNINWFPFDIKAEEQLKKYKSNLIAHLDAPFSAWEDLIDTIDCSSYDVFSQLQTDHIDGRIGCYQNLFASMHRYILNNLLALDNFEKAKEVYTASIKFFAEVLEDVQWPEELDEF